MVQNALKSTKDFQIAFADKMQTEKKYTLFANISPINFTSSFPKENFTDIAYRFKKLSNNEKMQDETYKTRLIHLREKKSFRRSTDVVWVCQNCGYVHIGMEAPTRCPICNQLQNSFKIEGGALK